MRFNPCYLMFLFFLLACSGKNSGHDIKQGSMEVLGYDFNKPSEIFELPDELEEVSGLAAISDKHLLCNEDETGTLYLFNIGKGEVEEELKWGDDGDYEGLAVLEGDAYVLKSSGKVFRIRNYMSSAPEVTGMKTGIAKGCDAEGLTVLPGRNSLLIACKKGDSESRYIYEFDLEKGFLQQAPYLQLKLAEIEDLIANTDLDKVSLELWKILDPKSSSGVLFPSGIAFHPKTNDLFILSARSRLLVIYSEDKLKNVIELTHEAFRQAEGIAFTPNGDLYIGNEGKGGKANILKFNYDQ